MRPGLEHRPQPRDPFRVDEANALEALRRDWGRDYALKVRKDGTWEAARKQRPHVTLEARTPDGLYRLLLADSVTR